MKFDPEIQSMIEHMAVAMAVEIEAVEHAIERAMFARPVEELKRKSQELSLELKKLEKN